MLQNQKVHIIHKDKNGEVRIFKRRCVRCDKIYDTPAKRSCICSNCYLPKTQKNPRNSIHFQYAGIAQK